MLFRSTATTEIYTRRNTLSLHDALPILVALLAVTVELTLAAVQWALTPRGVRLQRTQVSA